MVCLRVWLQYQLVWHWYGYNIHCIIHWFDDMATISTLLDIGTMVWLQYPTLLDIGLMVWLQYPLY